MKPFGEKFACDQCKEKFGKYEDLIAHARHEHHRTIVKCTECGKEFVHEADRLHHAREEHQKKIANRPHKHEHKHEVENPSPQAEVDAHTRNFGDNF